MTGKVKTLTDKGFGFITVAGQKKDMFFHSKQLQNVHYADLKEGDELEFETADGDKGPYATNIYLAEGN